MTHLLDMELDAPRREELERQFAASPPWRSR